MATNNERRLISVNPPTVAAVYDRLYAGRLYSAHTVQLIYEGILYFCM